MDKIGVLFKVNHNSIAPPEEWYPFKYEEVLTLTPYGIRPARGLCNPWREVPATPFSLGYRAGALLWF